MWLPWGRITGWLTAPFAGKTCLPATASGTKLPMPCSMCHTIKILRHTRFCMATSYLVNVQKSACGEQQRLTVVSVELAVMYIIHYCLTIYKVPPTAHGQWVFAYGNRKGFIYEKERIRIGTRGKRVRGGGYHRSDHSSRERRSTFRSQYGALQMLLCVPERRFLPQSF